MSPEQALNELESITATFRLAAAAEGSRPAARLRPLKTLLVGDIGNPLLIFAGAVAAVLLVACANVANLMLIRAASRQQEIAVRAGLGAGRGRLVRQLLTESLVVAVAGGIGGLLLGAWGVRALLSLAPAGKIPRVEQIHLDGSVLAFTLGVSLLTGLVFGLAPALHATRRELRESLSQGARNLGGRRERLRSALVVSEIALALVLLAGAGLMVKSVRRLRAVDPGFRPDNVVAMTVDLPAATYRTPAQMIAFHRATLAKLSALPGVVAAGAVNLRPLGDQMTVGDFQLEGGGSLPRGYVVAQAERESGLLPCDGRSPAGRARLHGA